MSNTLYEEDSTKKNSSPASSYKKEIHILPRSDSQPSCDGFYVSVEPYKNLLEVSVISGVRDSNSSPIG